MVQGIYGKKLGMSQVYGEGGKLTPVTAIEAGPCTVAQVKTMEKDGYSAIQVAFEETKKLNSAEKGHLKDLGQFKHLREIRTGEKETYQVGQKIDVSLFKPGDKVSVTGISRGRGFAGVVKRYHFKGSAKTHGASDRVRAPGSVGADRPARVIPGYRMAGHMGDHKTTVKNLIVVQADPARNLLFLRGAVPGGQNGVIFVKKLEKGK